MRYELTNAAWICRCWQNSRYFYKAHLSTLQANKQERFFRKYKTLIQPGSGYSKENLTPDPVRTGVGN